MSMNLYFTTEFYFDAQNLLVDEDGNFDYDLYDDLCQNDLNLDIINDPSGSYSWCYIGTSFINIDPYKSSVDHVELSLPDFAVAYHDVQTKIQTLLDQYNIKYVIWPSDVKFVTMSNWW